jgi:hypothetical protein
MLRLTTVGNWPTAMLSAEPVMNAAMAGKGMKSTINPSRTMPRKKTMEPVDARSRQPTLYPSFRPPLGRTGDDGECRGDDVSLEVGMRLLCVQHDVSDKLRHDSDWADGDILTARGEMVSSALAAGSSEGCSIPGSERPVDEDTDK